MDMACLLPLIILLLLLSSLPSRSDDQLTQGKPLFPGDKLISENGVFALGFFSPTNSNESLYIAICYHGIPEQLPVWVANRDNPATSTAASPAKLAITQNQGLVLSDTGGRRTFWTTAANTTAGAGVAVAVLLNSGNFVLRSANGTVLLWQSFDHPTAVILPTMRVLFRYKGRVATRLFAWKGPSDPSTGGLSGSIDPGSNLRFFIWNGTRPYSRINLFNDVAMFGGSGATTSVAQWMDNTGDELYFTYRVSDGGSPYTRLLFEYNGKMKLETWSNTTSSWKVMFESPSSACDLYAWCGSFGYCDSTEGVPTCRCLDGFEPVDGRDLSRGCRRTEALECGKEARFVTMTGMRLPDKFVDVWNRNGSFDECAAECRDNCSCTAFAYISKSNAPALIYVSRCLVWTGDLVDTGKAAGFGRELYLRLAGSHVKNKINFAKIVPPVIALLLLLTCAALFWKRKYQGKRQRKEARRRMMLQYLRSPDEAEDKNIEFPFIRFEDIVVATDNFADSNMLGKGGFGNVYKGMLDGTKEVAIKRLSKGSGQGTEEFRNEVVLIAKLQHKNLVKLLGCCIHENEKLLVYEYLPNKSLDYFLFDSSRKSMLQWDTRCKIIQGIARGILYLHQDSRLTIIHRDLKPSNILLDKEMSPKISDFGMARIFYGEQHQANTNRVVGTYGYMSPEYAMEGAFSVKSDTYSFGVLLLEIVSGLKISSPQLIMDFPNLIVYAWNLWKDGKAEDLLDSSVKEYCPSDEVSRCIHIGLLCVQDHPECRPLMSAVVSMLENKTTQLPVPTEPVYFVRRDAEPGRAGNKVLSLNDMTFTELEGR